MKQHVTAIWNGLPKPIKEYAHTMLVGAGIGALTAGTAKIFQKLNVPHPAEPVRPQRPYQPHAERPHQHPRWQPGRQSWAKSEDQRRNDNPKGGWHGR